MHRIIIVKEIEKNCSTRSNNQIGTKVSYRDEKLNSKIPIPSEIQVSRPFLISDWDSRGTRTYVSIWRDRQTNIHEYTRMSTCSYTHNSLGIRFIREQSVFIRKRPRREVAPYIFHALRLLRSSIFIFIIFLRPYERFYTATYHFSCFSPTEGYITYYLFSSSLLCISRSFLSRSTSTKCQTDIWIYVWTYIMCINIRLPNDFV